MMDAVEVIYCLIFTHIAAYIYIYIYVYRCLILISTIGLRHQRLVRPAGGFRIEGSHLGPLREALCALAMWHSQTQEVLFHSVAFIGIPTGGVSTDSARAHSFSTDARIQLIGHTAIPWWHRFM